MTHNMKLRLTLVVAVVAGSSLAPGARLARAQQGPVVPQPTPEHELLKKDVGTWDAKVKSWNAPDAQPIETAAVEKNEMLPGGLWLLTRFDGAFGDLKFFGVGQTGYDPESKKYIGTWIDNMNPYIMVTKGTYDAATKTMTATGEMREPGNPQPVPLKNVSRYVDDNTRNFAMYATGADGKEWKMLEITYKRRAN